MTDVEPRSFPGLGHRYDLAVVGAGLTGTEVALRCARSGWDVLLVTTSLDTIYNLAAERAKLEPAPGTLMAELGEELADDEGGVESWALHRGAKYALEHAPGIHLLQSSVSALRVEDGAVTGVETWEGVTRLAERTALCVGSFLKARLTVGTLTETAGRLSEMAYDDLYLDLEHHGLEFSPLHLEADSGNGSLPYRVECKVLADAAVARDFRVRGFDRLYAAGLCASGYLTYEDAAKQGLELAKTLLSAEP